MLTISFCYWLFGPASKLGLRGLKLGMGVTGSLGNIQTGCCHCSCCCCLAVFTTLLGLLARKSIARCLRQRGMSRRQTSGHETSRPFRPNRPGSFLLCDGSRLLPAAISLQLRYSFLVPLIRCLVLYPFS